MIRVNYVEHRIHGLVSREALFNSEKELSGFLDQEYQWAYNEQCQGVGNGTIGHLQIKIHREDGSIEEIN